MTIAKRLMILVAGALIGCLVIGGAAITQTVGIKDSSLKVSTVTIPSVVTIDKILSDFDSIRGLTYRHIIQADPTQASIAKTRKELEDAIRAYTKLGHDEKDKALFATAKAHINAYLAEMDKSLEYSRNNKMLEAGASAETLATVGDQAVQAIKANVEYNITLSDQSRSAVNSAITKAKLTIGASIALTIVLLSTLGFLMHRQISSSLNSARETIKAIESSLDFTIRTEVKGNDEISQTLKVFNLLIEHQTLRTSQQSVARFYF
jgi:methyl-accepting chemotaxis protein